ncbi:MAG: hypothetical protein PHG95_01055 [Patescibacteria group bacterium]|nr:hypothetical protein [Patescibacteria group bacterium]
MLKFKFSLTFEGLWLWLMLFTSASALVYFLYALDIIGLIAAFLIAGIVYTALNKQIKEPTSAKNTIKNSKYFYLFSTAALILIISMLALAAGSATDKAIISPWTVINPWFFPLLLAANLSLIAALTRNGNNKYKNILLGLYYLAIFSVAAIVYRLGYGFDPFIHQAAMAEINRVGFILPKTPYYIGQYSLIIALHKISGLSLALINQYFLPLISALSLPWLLSQLRQKSSRPEAWLAIIMLALIGFSPFILSTPQNFSYLLLLATIIFIYRQKNEALIISTALAAFAIHPLAGIPAVLAAAWSFMQARWPRPKISRLLKEPTIIFSASFLAFCFSLWAVSGFASLSWQNFNLSLLNPVFKNNENYWLNLSYFFINNYFWLILGAVLIMIFRRRQIWPEESSKEANNLRLFSAASLAAIAAYLISRSFSFNNLIAYEQGDYASRLPIIAIIIAIPLFYELFRYLGQRSLKMEKLFKLTATIGLAFIMLASTYASYPRFDNYYNSRGYSTGEADITSVKKAEERADGEKYIALANQQVSAAALHEFGFYNRYIKKDGQEIYFYPIPTGGPLYQYYLDMVYGKASRQNMTAAMDFTGVNRAYLIVNKYWWASDKIIAEAKMSADYWEKIGQGEDYLFEYRK